ncbi:hypothetical protein niasHT_024529 [Heterodera trifolii]|uniref:C2H2-type domain-containing protein n=1 Tax=Heterodera trifolii TaxID=157864 RepID=A0ABD2K7A1_9BILA
MSHKRCTSVGSERQDHSNREISLMLDASANRFYHHFGTRTSSSNDEIRAQLKRCPICMEIFVRGATQRGHFKRHLEETYKGHCLTEENLELISSKIDLLTRCQNDQLACNSPISSELVDSLLDDILQLSIHEEQREKLKNFLRTFGVLTFADFIMNDYYVGDHPALKDPKRKDYDVKSCLNYQAIYASSFYEKFGMQLQRSQQFSEASKHANVNRTPIIPPVGVNRITHKTAFDSERVVAMSVGERKRKLGKRRAFLYESDSDEDNNVNSNSVQKKRHKNLQRSQQFSEAPKHADVDHTPIIPPVSVKSKTQNKAYDIEHVVAMDVEERKRKLGKRLAFLFETDSDEDNDVNSNRVQKKTHEKIDQFRAAFDELRHNVVRYSVKNQCNLFERIYKEFFRLSLLGHMPSVRSFGKLGLNRLDANYLYKLKDACQNVVDTCCESDDVTSEDFALLINQLMAMNSMILGGPLE